MNKWQVLLLLLIMSPISALSADFTEYSLKSGVGVKGLSMGGAQTAIPNSGTAIFYNPAVLARMSNFYEYDVLDAKKETFSVADSHRGKIGPFGLGLTTFGTDNGDKSAVFAISFSRQGNKGVDWGVTYKTVNSTVSGVSTSGWSTDLGVIANVSKSMWVGMTVQDIVGERVNVPLSIRTGLTYATMGDELIMTSDLVYYRGRSTAQIEPHLGAEYAIAPGLTLRAGWFDGSLTGGAQIQVPWVMLNYGVVQAAEGKRETMHLVGLTFLPPARSK